MAALGLAALLGGCGARGPREFEVAAGHYEATFDAARATLRDWGFELDRVDGRAGVISTHPKTTAGAATPWDAEQSSLRAELEDMANRQQRRVRVTFEPAAPAADWQPGIDLPDPEGPTVARVLVVVERLYRPGMRLEPSAISLSSRWSDPVLIDRGVQPGAEVVVRQDLALADRLGAAIRRRAGAPVPRGPEHASSSER